MHDAAHTFPRLNEPVPDFTVKTKHGGRTLRDYKDKWLILFSHPADFTPVCTTESTTEVIGFAKAADTFKGMNCKRRPSPARRYRPVSIWSRRSAASA